ncbi:DUF2813 domain-containing protein [Galactobacter valiniphilus]|uniref:DUF2813 domain-containing protein n=1 Tax=Galactobacter valiniphilus TaxID=2676122 RepID=A0A399JDF2_9MICC|nr:AAA family ATPase [Galactobacter valiniphilus]RII42062.1 DUF2813 domain-containing protein [Galactobacter valiniphilus]
MPGSQLNAVEKKLADRWDASKDTFGYLRGVKVEPGDVSVPAPGIRGIANVDLRLRYPVTVLVGPNGAGKTTLLNLCSLAFHSEDPKQTFKFSEFFFSTAEEKAPTNLRITWTYGTEKQGGRAQTTMKRMELRKWMTYSRRPTKPSYFIGIGRIVPPTQSGPSRRALASSGKPDRVFKDDDWVSEQMSAIFNRKYSGTEMAEKSAYRVGQIKRGPETKYSSFNMGTGEIAVWRMLRRLSTAPKNSLVAIEEVELGIHQSAQAAIAQTLVRAADKFSLQIVTTSHAREFIDNLPRRSRILVEPEGITTRRCSVEVTTRLAQTTLMGRHESNHELLIVCEDDLAEALIQEFLTRDERKRVKIVPFGAKNQLVKTALDLHKNQPKLPILIAWDGETTDKEIRDAVSSVGTTEPVQSFFNSGLLSWTRLGSETIMQSGYQHKPEVDAPEPMICSTLLSETADLGGLADQFGTTEHELRAFLENSGLEFPDKHSFFYEISLRMALAPEVVRAGIVHAFVQTLVGSGEEIPLVTSVRRALGATRNPVEWPSSPKKGEATSS